MQSVSLFSGYQNFGNDSIKFKRATLIYKVTLLSPHQNDHLIVTLIIQLFYKILKHDNDKKQYNQQLHTMIF